MRKIAKRPRGRPPINLETMQQISIRLPTEWIDCVDREAEKRGVSRNEVIRECIESANHIK